MAVSINPPKTPVTTGSHGTATATVPNVCKMPGPPAPFVPTPLPNIGDSNTAPKGYSKSVNIHGKQVAIRGASFGSKGDSASAATGGGLVSATTHGRTTFVGPGSMDVKIEGKNVQLLGDPMLNNCAGTGSPANAATMLGVIQASGMVTVVEAGNCVVCGQEHDGLEETEATKTDVGVLRIQFEAQIKTLESRRVAGKEMLRQHWLASHGKEPPADRMKTAVSVRTMLAVAECKCGKQYADQSGLTTIELCNAAVEAGMRHANGVTVSYSSGKRLRASMRQAQSRSVLDKLRAFSAGDPNIELRWSRLDQLAERSECGQATAYPPGNCAAQRALVLLIDDNALPHAMTEEWYHDRGRPTESAVEYIDARGPRREVKVETFANRDTVPPCQTCNLLIPLAICTRGEQTCSHKT